MSPAVGVLWVCGAILITTGSWRSWRRVRGSLLPAVHGSGPPLAPDPAAPDRPPDAPAVSPAREVARSLWSIVLAVGWLLVALLGLFMLTVASRATR